MKIQTISFSIAIFAIASSCACAQVGGVPLPTRPIDLGGPDNGLQFNDSPEISRADGVSLEASSPSDSLYAAPRSLPVNTGPSHVGGVLNEATLANVPHTCDTPVVWQQPNRQTSPIIQILTRDECNAAGLWATYPAERAAECAHMWAKIGRHGGCTSCQSSGGCGCDGAVMAGGRTKGHHFNRYRQDACDACDTLAGVVPSKQQPNGQMVSYPTRPGQPSGHYANQPLSSQQFQARPGTIKQLAPPQLPPHQVHTPQSSMQPAPVGRPPHTASAAQPHSQTVLPVGYRR